MSYIMKISQIKTTEINKLCGVSQYEQQGDNFFGKKVISFVFVRMRTLSKTKQSPFFEYFC
jgi:hypothetical protein